MQNSFRYDSGIILKAQELPNGHLRAYLRLGKANQKLRYFNSDGSQRFEMITPEALFHKDTLESFRLLPITLNHPSVPLNDSNSTQFTRGFTGDSLVQEGEFLGAVSTIIDKETKQAILSKVSAQVSPGYLTQLDSSDGDGTEANPYKQMYRLGNHIACVKNGRHGDSVNFQLDSAESDLWVSESNSAIYRADSYDEEYINSILLNQDSSNHKLFQKSIIDLSNTLANIHKGKQKMPTSISLGKRIFTVDSDDATALADGIANLQTRLDTLETELTTIKSEKTSLESELATVKAESSRLDGLLEVTKEQLTEAEKRPVYNADAAAEEMANKMSECIGLWTKVLPELRADNAEFEPDFKMDAVNIQRLSLLNKKPELAQNERFNKDAGYVAGLFEAMSLQASTAKADTSEETRADEQENISMSLLGMIEAARKDSAETVEGERSDMVGGASYSSGSGKEKESPIAKKRRERSMKPVSEVAK